MNILAIGDVIGKVGIDKLKSVLPKIKEEYLIDFAIVNGENSADGMGITEKIYADFLDMGIDVVTMGNHTWGKKDVFKIIDEDRLIRPANYSKDVVGKGYGTYESKGKKIAVINLIGRVDMNVLSDNPFISADEILEDVKGKADFVIVDFHAEATAEKIAMAYYLDGRVNVLFCTHTHVQTADETVMEKGMGYITDIGMTGPERSIIGMDIESSLKRFLTSIPERYKVAEGKACFNGVVFEINEENGRVENIIRLLL